MEPDIALHALDPGLQRLLTDIAEKHFGVSDQRTERARIADMLLEGLTREQVAENLGLPLAQIPILLAAPTRLQ